MQELGVIKSKKPNVVSSCVIITCAETAFRHKLWILDFKREKNHMANYFFHSQARNFITGVALGYTKEKSKHIVHIIENEWLL